MKKEFFCVFFFVLCFFSNGQNRDTIDLDSLLNEIYSIKFSVTEGGMELESFAPVFKLLKIYDSIQDPNLRADANEALGYFYTSTFEFETAIAYFSKALDDYHASSQWMKFAETSKQLAMIHCDLKQFDAAEKVLLKSLEIAQTHYLGFYILKPLQEITILYSYHKNKPKEAIVYGNLFIEKLNKFKSEGIDNADFNYSKTIDAAIVNLEMGNSYLKLKQYDYAKYHLEKSLDFFLPTDDQEKLTRIYKHLFTWALQTNQEKSVTLDYLERFYTYNTGYYLDYVTSIRGRVNNIEQINNYVDKLEKEKQNYLKERGLREKITWLLVALIVLSLITILILRKLYITQKKYNKKLTEEKETLMSIDKERQLYFSIISHELRTPMFAISGLIDVLKKNKNSLKSNDDDVLTSLEASSNYLKHLIGNILIFDATKGNGDKIKIKLEEFELKEFLSFISNKFLVLAVKKDVRINLDFKNIKEDLVVYAFKDGLDQVLSNLIINAIKFSQKEQSVTIAAEQHSIPDTNKIAVKFSIKDEGEGIDEELQSKLFEFGKKFDSDEEVNTKKMEGIGIGLSVVYHLLKKCFNSEIRIDSKKQEGSTFSFTIIFDESQKLCVSKSNLDNPQNPLNILVIDDNRIALMVTKKLLENATLNCYTCTDEDDVLSIIEDKQIDVVVVDINMPYINGYEMTKLIKEKFTIPVIAHTAGEEVSVSDEKVIQAKIDDVLIKPYSARDFKVKLDKLNFGLINT
ncbi:ATP-binding protein [Winogradskyella forsetii]|nr:ATP-binding protein [Winogradskyella forsetii]